jgi:putative cell wall-binding protein
MRAPRAALTSALEARNKQGGQRRRMNRAIGGVTLALCVVVTFMGAVPAAHASESTNYDWASLVLTDGGWPASQNNIDVVTEWMEAENYPSNWWLRNNPLNDDAGTSTGTPLGTYPDLPTAASHVVGSLNNGFYGAVVADLAASASPSTTAQAICNSPWDVAHYGDCANFPSQPPTSYAAPASAWSGGGGGGSGPSNCVSPIPDGTLFYESDNTQQYIWWYGASLPVSYADALNFTAAGFAPACLEGANLPQTNPSSNLPNDTVVLVVGTPSQHLYSGGQLLPIGAPGTSSCLLFRYLQSAPATVPTMWSDTIPPGPGVPCNLPDGTRFDTTNNPQQYIAYGSASLPVGYGDAVNYVNEGNTAVSTMAPDYVTGHPASNLPNDTVIRIVGLPTQYLYANGQLEEIGSPNVSACLLNEYGQASPDVVPTMWSGSIPPGPGAQCPAGGSSSGSSGGSSSGGSSGGSSDGSGGSGSMPPATSVTPTRLAGAVRESTAIATAQAAFPIPGSAKAVVLATEDNFPDALAGGPLAAHLGGPLLLTSPEQVDPAVMAEIQQLLLAPGQVYLLGGEDALSPTVASQLEAAGYRVTRLAGADRAATAVAIADAIGAPTAIFEVTGESFADALSAGAAAAAGEGVVVLTDGSSQAPETAAYTSAHPGVTRYAVGGPAAQADTEATSIVGADRYATAVAVASLFFRDPSVVGVATGLNYPDALAAASFLAGKGPLLLVPTDGVLPQSVYAYLSYTQPQAVDIFGGTAAVGTDVADQL